MKKCRGDVMGINYAFWREVVWMGRLAWSIREDWLGECAQRNNLFSLSVSYHHYSNPIHKSRVISH
jgi:hypothetical protein